MLRRVFPGITTAHHRPHADHHCAVPVANRATGHRRPYKRHPDRRTVLFIAVRPSERTADFGPSDAHPHDIDAHPSAV